MGPPGSIFFWALTALVVLAPLYKGGNRPLPLLLLELGAAGVLFGVAATRGRPIVLPATMWIAIVILLVYPLIQIVPMAFSIWASLPGHSAYAEVARDFAGNVATSGWHAISIVPQETLSGWLALLPVLACFFAAMRISARQAGRLVLVMVIVAALESLFGLLQVGTLHVEVFDTLRNDRAFGTATGTFVNRSHFAALLAMMLPVMVGLLVIGDRRGLRIGASPHRAASESRAQSALLYAAAIMMLVCLLFTRSRAGIITSLVGLGFAAIILFRARRAHGETSPTRWAIVFVLGLIVIAALLALAIGVTPIVSSLEPERLQMSAGTRLATYIGTIRAALEFLPFGSGLSTFASVYPRFQLEGGREYAGTFMNAAHNDYLQAFMELGLAGGAAVALLLLAYVIRMAQLASRERGRRFTLLQLAAGAGMLPMMLHSLFDFPLHIPANAIWFAVLAGVLFHRSGDSDDTSTG